MSTVPDFMPVLSAGMHGSPEEGACVMEYVSIIAGEKFTDTPNCTDWAVSVIFQQVNDSLSDRNRHLMIPFITRLPGIRLGYLQGKSLDLLKKIVLDYFPGTETEDIDSASDLLTEVKSDLYAVRFAAAQAVWISNNSDCVAPVLTLEQIEQMVIDSYIPFLTDFVNFYDEYTGRIPQTDLTQSEIDMIREVVSA